ncbi:hypothetical protein MBLNU457_4130t1 [Dothideomycetes sp. NU457]
MSSDDPFGPTVEKKKSNTDGATQAPLQQDGRKKKRVMFSRMIRSDRRKSASNYASSFSDGEEAQKKPEKWSMGVLNDKDTDEVPGSILLLSKVHNRNEPLGIRHTPARTSTSSLPQSPFHTNHASSMPPQTPVPETEEEKRTADGKIVLNPQPDDSPNDPLNWAPWRRDAALFSLGFFCMLGGGMTPVLAAGFHDVAETYNVSVPQVALTTGFYMLGLGVGSVIMSPTAILFGKRPVYLFGSIVFVLTSVWCALSPNYPSLVVARVFMGIAVSPVECLPSATVAEIFFLHERAYRLGIYTLLLLGGKNLIPLVSAAIINSLGWRWVFWIVAIIVGFGGTLLFFFVPETFWDRTPRPHKRRGSRSSDRAQSHVSLHNIFRRHEHHGDQPTPTAESANMALATPTQASGVAQRRRQAKHAHFGDGDDGDVSPGKIDQAETHNSVVSAEDEKLDRPDSGLHSAVASDTLRDTEKAKDIAPVTPAKARPSLTLDVEKAALDRQTSGYFTANPLANVNHPTTPTLRRLAPQNSDLAETPVSENHVPTPGGIRYTQYYRTAPPKSYVQTLKPYAGRMSNDNWFKVAFRPFILYAYPSILWSSVVYALSVGWLIVLSESVSTIFESKQTYNFTALQAGLIYLSPFIGGVLGTAVAGKVSDVIVRFLARRNGGVYEPEFRLIMAIPVALSTVIGLMGYGWAAQERDAWIVPTIFFGVISFGCCVGSTTAITFAVDSYRQYAGEALVTLNFSKNILHGLVFSLFFNNWLNADGSKDVFITLGGIQLFFLLWTIPMYIYGKRARMWTVRKNLMEKF